MISLSWTSRPPCSLNDRSLWTSTLFAFTSRYAISDIATAVGGSIHLSTWKVEPFIDCRSNLSFPHQETPMSNQRGLWRKVLRNILCPQPSTTNLCLKEPIGIWCAPSNMVWESYMWDGNLYRQNIIDPSWNYERYASVHLPEALSTTTLTTIFDAKPNTHSAMVPRLAVSADVRGNQVYTAEFKSLRYPVIPSSPETFKDWSTSACRRTSSPFHHLQM
jgi:hypothetical protein